MPRLGGAGGRGGELGLSKFAMKLPPKIPILKLDKIKKVEPKKPTY